MPFGGHDWLALTPEPTLAPELPICDPHHHFWDFRTERMPYQRYLLHELAADIHSGHHVRATVFIEARAMYRADGPEEMRPVGEVEFAQGLAAASASGLYGPGRAAAAIIGGIGMPRTGFDWHTRQKPIGSEELAKAMPPWMTHCIEQFGPERCMFESNFPVDKVSYSYNVLYNAFKRVSKPYSTTERAAMFHDTAARVYRIDV
jgi:predicted TIM-barrel fold metal-dependent hydrolase